MTHHDKVNAAYARIIDLFLALKAEGFSADVLADAIARAAYQAEIEYFRRNG